MKPQSGAAWDVQPTQYETVNEPGSERSMTFQPECNHPDFWPGQVMGFDYAGGAKVIPAMDQTPSGAPAEAHLDDIRKIEVLKDVNYDRKPGYTQPMDGSSPSNRRRLDDKNPVF